LKILDFIDSLCFTQKLYALLTGSAATALTVRRNLRGLSIDLCRPAREIFYHCYRMGDIEVGWDKLTVGTVRLKLLTGSFRLGQLLYLQTDIRLIF
jgi:hypothetical protein